MLRRSLLIFGLACLFVVGTSQPALGQPAQASAADAGAEVTMAWFDLQLKLAKETPGFSPPVASRAFGYTSVALYEAVVPGMPGYRTLAGQLNELTELPQPVAGIDYHWETVANSALATITRRMFPNASDENAAAIEALYTEFAKEFEAALEPDLFARSVTQGRVVADAIYIWSMDDGGYEGFRQNFPPGYTPVAGDGMWVPTPRQDGDPQPALQPFWGDNRPFVLTAGDECMPSAPPDYSEENGSVFYQEAMEVYEAVQNLTPEQLEIAQFWADNPGQTSTPPGHSISILTQVLRQEDASLAQAAEAYAKLGMAVADAFIGCWHAKYEYNLVRPVTYINQLVDSDWMPPVVTPPFPEYPSGHSVQSGATAEVLTDLFGDNYAFTDHTHVSRNFEPRAFDSFFDFAQEAAISRLYGGIHYRAAIEIGLEQGRCIGKRINQIQFRSV
jgi:hypothetical protein